ncbi:hypothetical protein [Listeria monocytogenes]|nr:hypothetical protein [Listeria monocytogenes]
MIILEPLLVGAMLPGVAVAFVIWIFDLIAIKAKEMEVEQGDE